MGKMANVFSLLWIIGFTISSVFYYGKDTSAFLACATCVLLGCLFNYEISED